MRNLPILAAAALFLLASCHHVEPYGAIPTQDQLAWQDMEMYAFIHYSMNTYTDQEWGFGNEDPALFNPSDLDCRQWARVCKQAGMKGIIFTAKHHCGFCMWPSAYTEYSVKNAPWKDGKGDVVRELADACREEGLKFAVYLSPWDRNYAEYGRPEYITYFRNQLRELLTNYGDIFEVWFDGANGGDGWYGGANETRRIDKYYYDWPETYRLIRELQPHCVIWGDNANRADLRWVGTEAGNVGETNWSTMPSEGQAGYAMLHYGVEDGDVWCPGETNTSIRPGWFYHETENAHVKSLSKLMDTYYKSVGRNSTLLLNFPVAPNGRIHPTDSLRGIAFKKMIDEVFKENLVDKAHVSRKGLTTTVSFRRPTEFNRFVAEEDIALGQRVKKFSLEALVDGAWLLAAAHGRARGGRRRPHHHRPSPHHLLPDGEGVEAPLHDRRHEGRARDQEDRALPRSRTDGRYSRQRRETLVGPAHFLQQPDADADGLGHRADGDGVPVPPAAGRHERYHHPLHPLGRHKLAGLEEACLRRILQHRQQPHLAEPFLPGDEGPHAQVRR